MTIVRKVVLLVMGLVWLLPIYLLLANASKTNDQYGALGVWVPGWTGLPGNLAQAWTQGEIASGLASSTLYSLVSPALAVIIGAAAGFAIIALRLKAGFVWFVVIFCSTVFPIQMILMPLFIGFVELNLYDTHFGMIVVYTVISVPFSAFVMRNFFSSIAHSIYEAAAMDGASAGRIFWQIYLPMARPALVAVFILQATFIWNDLLLGLTLSQSTAVRPVMPALAALQTTYGGSTMPTVLAGGLLISVPTVVLFLATQKFFSRGLALGQF